MNWKSLRASVFAAQAGIALIALSLIFAPSLISQQPQPMSGGAGQQGRGAGGGMANAGPQKAEFDSQHRPITAGGFVKEGPTIFQDVAEKAGLASWRHKAGTPEKKLILEAKGPGVCLIIKCRYP